MPYSDKHKQREYQRDFMRKKCRENPCWHAEVARRKKQSRQVVRDIVTQIKRTFGCLLCGESNPDNLHFHHIMPAMKSSSIADLVGNRSKLMIIMKEIDKCVCVCSVCHKQLQRNIDYLLANIQSEKWVKDWGIIEALEYSSIHPQYRMKGMYFIDVIKAVARNCQIQDTRRFEVAAKT